MLLNIIKVQNFLVNDILYPSNNFKLLEILENNKIQEKINRIQRRIENKGCSMQEMKLFLLFLSWAAYREYLLEKKENKTKKGFVLRDNIRKKIKDYYKSENIEIDITDEIIVGYLLKLKRLEIQISETNLKKAINYLSNIRSKDQLLFFYLFSMEKEEGKKLLDFIKISKSKKINEYIDKNIRYLCIKNKDKIKYHILKKTFEYVSKNMIHREKQIFLGRTFKYLDKESNETHVFNVDTYVNTLFSNPKNTGNNEYKECKINKMISIYIDKIINLEIKYKFSCEELGDKIFNENIKIYDSENHIPLISETSIKSKLAYEISRNRDIHFYLNNPLFFKFFSKKKKEKVIKRLKELLNKRSTLFLNKSQRDLIVLYIYKYMIGDKVGFMGILPYFEVFVREFIIKKDYLEVIKLDSQRLNSAALSTLIRKDFIYEEMKKMLGEGMFEKFILLFDVDQMNLKNNYSHGLFKDETQIEDLADYVFVYSINFFLNHGN